MNIKFALYTIVFFFVCSCSDEEFNYNYSSNNSFIINVNESSNNNYLLSGNDRNGKFSGKDPSLTFKVGDKIIFNISATGHPFYLKTKKGIGTDNLIRFVINNGTDNGMISWNAKDNINIKNTYSTQSNISGKYHYQCSIHKEMYGTINIID
tara:strand:+ start:27 stop:482 length:456 start_codon:yes stop_codon:yes gene_type:complete